MENQTTCPRCSENLIASMWSEYLSAAEMRQFWCCPVCGNMFETLDEVDPKTKMPIGLAQQFLPSLLVA